MDIVKEVDELCNAWIAYADKHNKTIDDTFIAMAVEGIEESSPVKGLIKATLKIEMVERLMKAA
mgnify:CR=1 FL=1